MLAWSPPTNLGQTFWMKRQGSHRSGSSLGWAQASSTIPAERGGSSKCPHPMPSAKLLSAGIRALGDSPASHLLTLGTYENMKMHNGNPWWSIFSPRCALRCLQALTPGQTAAVDDYCLLLTTQDPAQAPQPLDKIGLMTVLTPGSSYEEEWGNHSENNCMFILVL